MNLNRWVALGFVFSVAVAIALRCPRLGERPMHNDEGVNGVKFGALWEGRGYKYDPHEFHGPTLPYATETIGKLSRAPGYQDWTEARLRTVTVVFSIATILLIPLLADGIGWRGCCWAALLTAVSPAMVFYSRYYIHETLLVFFTVAAVAAGWRYWRSRKVTWVVLAGVSAGCMQGTKETFVFSIVAAIGALVANHLWNRRFDASGLPINARRLSASHVAIAIGCWVVAMIVLFTSFFSNWHGPVDAFRTYAAWANRAGANSSQAQPWYFYFQRLLYFRANHGPVWTEMLILALAGVAVVTAFSRKQMQSANASFLRFLALFGLALVVIYSAISYKTPWCVLTFWQIFILLAGSGAAVLIRIAKYQWAKLVTGILLAMGAAQLAGQSWESSIEFAADPRNPYVYAHTSPDVLDLVKTVQNLARLRPADMRIEVVAMDGDYWPLPWYFRNLSGVGWFDHSIAKAFAPVIIVSPAFQDDFEREQGYVMAGFYALRPRVFLTLFVRQDLWGQYLETKRQPHR
jgi:uncharacterized protein (TIGR03663 family)